jgi:hypothetical protein
MPLKIIAFYYKSPHYRAPTSTFNKSCAILCGHTLRTLFDKILFHNPQSMRSLFFSTSLFIKLFVPLLQSETKPPPPELSVWQECKILTKKLCGYPLTPAEVTYDETPFKELNPVKEMLNGLMLSSFADLAFNAFPYSLRLAWHEKILSPLISTLANMGVFLGSLSLVEKITEACLSSIPISAQLKEILHPWFLELGYLLLHLPIPQIQVNEEGLTISFPNLNPHKTLYSLEKQSQYAHQLAPQEASFLNINFHQEPNHITFKLLKIEHKDTSISTTISYLTQFGAQRTEVLTHSIQDSNVLLQTHSIKEQIGPTYNFFLAHYAPNGTIVYLNYNNPNFARPLCKQLNCMYLFEPKDLALHYNVHMPPQKHRPDALMHLPPLSLETQQQNLYFCGQISGTNWHPAILQTFIDPVTGCPFLNTLQINKLLTICSYVILAPDLYHARPLPTNLQVTTVGLTLINGGFIFHSELENNQHCSQSFFTKCPTITANQNEKFLAQAKFIMIPHHHIQHCTVRDFSDQTSQVMPVTGMVADLPFLTGILYEQVLPSDLACSVKKSGKSMGKVCIFKGKKYILKAAWSEEFTIVQLQASSIFSQFYNFALLAKMGIKFPRNILFIEEGGQIMPYDPSDKPIPCEVYNGSEFLDGYEENGQLLQTYERKLRLQHYRKFKTLPSSDAHTQKLALRHICLEKGEPLSIAQLATACTFIGDLCGHPSNWGFADGKLVIIDADISPTNLAAYPLLATQMPYNIHIIFSISDIQNMRNIYQQMLLQHPPQMHPLLDMQPDLYAFIVQNYLAAVENCLFTIESDPNLFNLKPHTPDLRLNENLSTSFHAMQRHFLNFISKKSSLRRFSQEQKEAVIARMLHPHYQSPRFKLSTTPISSRGIQDHDNP